MNIAKVAIAFAAAALAVSAKAEQPDLNMDDLRTFSRRFIMEHQPLHPHIEDRRVDDPVPLDAPPTAAPFVAMDRNTPLAHDLGTMELGPKPQPYQYRPWMWQTERK